MNNKKSLVIMVVEDETLLLQAIVKKLTLKGVETISCTSGQQALDYIKELPEMPDVIWLDYYLKDMNGIEFMEKIRDHDKAKDTPILVVSNSANTEKIEHMLALGASKYVIKAEHKLEEIIDIVEELVEDARKGKLLQ